MVQLTIKNFGAIHECALDINRITAFIGPQGSGKSTVAKLYTAFMWIEKSLTRETISRKDCNAEFFIKTLRYIEIDHLIESETFLDFIGENYHLCFENGQFSVRKRSVRNNSYILPQLLYMPAERSFLSVLNILSIENLSPVLYELASSFSDAREQIAKNGFDLPINGYTFHYDKANGTSTISDKNAEYSVRLNRAASGIQSILPLSIIFSYFLSKLEYKDRVSASVLTVGEAKRIRDIARKYTCSIKYRKTTPLTRILDKAGVEFVPDDKDEFDLFRKDIQEHIDLRLVAVIEEPEQNLFPEAQKELVEYLAKGINSNNGNLLLTTHSPYIIESLNNLIYAGELTRKGKHVDDIIPHDCQIRYDEVSAYLFKDGKVTSILDRKLRNVDAVRLDSCSDLINNTYGELEDAEFEAEIH